MSINRAIYSNSEVSEKKVKAFVKRKGQQRHNQHLCSSSSSIEVNALPLDHC